MNMMYTETVMFFSEYPVYMTPLACSGG